MKSSCRVARVLIAKRVSTARRCSTLSDAELHTQFYNEENLYKLIKAANASELQYLQNSDLVWENEKKYAVLLHIARRDPLFAKYKIDMIETIQGSKHAIDTILRAFGSKDFALNSDDASSQTRTVLRDLASEGAVSFQQRARRMDKFCGFMSVLQDLDVSEVAFPAASTHIAPEIPPGGFKASWWNPFGLPPFQAEPYPAGSVEGKVTVKCRVKETWEHSSAYGSVTLLIRMDLEATFRACISGQVPLQWKLESTNPSNVVNKFSF